MARLRSTLEIGVDNNASRPINQIDRDLERLRKDTERHNQALSDARGRLFDAAAAGWAVYNALAPAVAKGLEFSSMMQDISQKTDISRQRLAEMGREIRDLGLSTAQGASEVGKSVDLMMGYGFSEDVGLAVAEPIGKAATAYNAATEDLAGASAALVGNMRVPAEEVAYALDIMAQGGKEGAFELRDMAAEFPALTAAAQALGISGTKGTADLVAMLEVARKGAASGAEAATNTANFMQKILAPDSIKKFGAAGVDIVKEMDRATANGSSPIEHALGIINKITKGGRADLLGGLFADAQVQKFIKPLIANMDEYRRIRDAALNGKGVVEKDFQARLEGPAGVIQRFEASIENLNIALGLSLLPKITELVGAITPVIDGLAAFVDANGQLTAELVTIAAAIVSLRVLVAAGSWASLFLGGGAAGAAVGAGGALAGGAAAGGAAATVGGALGGIAAGGWMKLFGQAAIIYEVGKAEMTVLGGVEKIANSATSWPEATPDNIAGLQEEKRLLEERLANSPAPVDGGFDPNAAIRFQANEMANEIAHLQEQAAAGGAAAGAQLGRGTGQGLAAQAGTVVQQFLQVISDLRAIAASGVHVPVRVDGGSAAVLPARARGGNVWPGQGFLVGEEGPELVSFGGRGMVHTAHETAGMMNAYSPPPPPAFGGGANGAAKASTTISVGDIHISLGVVTQSDPQSLAQRLGDLVRSEIESAFSDAEMA